MEIKNSFWFRHFLMCNRLASLMVSARGWCVENFAKTIIESENGRFANNQMNVYFTMADRFLCELHQSEEDMMFDYLEDEGITIEDLAKLSTEQLNNYYDQYCIGYINFSNTHENS